MIAAIGPSQGECRSAVTAVAISAAASARSKPAQTVLQFADSWCEGRLDESQIVQGISAIPASAKKGAINRLSLITGITVPRSSRVNPAPRRHESGRS